MKKAQFIAAAYLVGSLLAYGHAFNNTQPTGYNSWTKRVEPRDTTDRFVLSLASAVVWPAYLSVQALSNHPGAQP